jgi:hypothetical protein
VAGIETPARGQEAAGGAQEKGSEKEIEKPRSSYRPAAIAPIVIINEYSSPTGFIISDRFTQVLPGFHGWRQEQSKR